MFYYVLVRNHEQKAKVLTVGVKKSLERSSGPWVFKVFVSSW